MSLRLPPRVWLLERERERERDIKNPFKEVTVLVNEISKWGYIEMILK